MGHGSVRWLFLLFLLGVLSCGEATFFFIWNTGALEGPPGAVAVFVIGTPSEEPLEDVRLVEGRIPRGMRIQDDGTIRGVPEEQGEFVVTLGMTFLDGRRTLVTYEALIE